MPKRPTKPPRKPAIDFSLAGLVYIGMTLFMGLAAVNSQANLLFAVFGLMVGIMVVSWTISRIVLRKLQMHRRLPEHAVVGRRAALLYDFRNTKRFWPSMSISVAELDGADAFTQPPQAYMLHAAARMTAVVPLEVIPRRRGLHALDRHQLTTSFPFGFIKRAVQRKKTDTLLVYPALATVDSKLLQRCLSAEFTTSKMRPRSGGSDEFYGVREFRSGDSPRWMNWRRSARTGTLVANEMTQVAPPRLIVCVDTRLREQTPEEHELVERCIAMAASLVEHSSDSNLMVGLHAWSGLWVSIKPSRGKQHRRALLTELARLPLNTEQGMEDLMETAAALVRPGVTLVVFTPHAPHADAMDLRAGRCLTIAADSDQARQWFRFEEGIDFAHCGPLEAEKKATKRRSDEATKGPLTTDH